jgi:hypothetical protein
MDNRGAVNPEKLEEFRWSGRPLAGLTDGELDQAITGREAALKGAAPKSIAAGLVKIALDRLEAEKTGRRLRKVTRWEA